MNWFRPFSSLLLLGFSVLILASSLELGIGDFRNPGPGLMGFLASLLLLLLTVIILIKESMTLAKAKERESSIGWEGLTKPLIVTVALCGYALFLKTLGYLLSTFLIMFIMLLVNNPRKWVLHTVNALLISNVTYLVFYKILRVLLPMGTLRIFW